MSKFICPYCFNENETNNILFRCINPNNAECPGEEDKLYSSYWGFHPPKIMNHVINPNTSMFNQKSKNALCPICRTKTTKMICPSCHNSLPFTTGELKDYNISLIGAKDAGKSVYIAVLLNALAQRIGMNLNASLVALNDETIRRYRQEFYQPLFQKKELLMGTASQGAAQKTPLLYRFGFEKKNFFGKRSNEVVTLVFFDTAGERLDNEDVMARETKYISNSSGIIFLLDPLQIPAVRDRLPPDIQLPPIHTQPEEIVTRVINLIREDKQIPEKERIKTPIALVFSKIDALRSLFPPDSMLQQSSPHTSSLDISDCEMVSSEMLAYLYDWIGPNLNNIMQHHFEHFCYFGVSALGEPPLGEKLSAAVSSNRIEDPFLWLLWKNGFIQGTKKKR
jgi:hypothetical protein